MNAAPEGATDNAWGEIPPGAVSPLVADLGSGILVQRFLGDSAPIPSEFLVAIVDDLIMPLAKISSPGSAGR